MLGEVFLLKRGGKKMLSLSAIFLTDMKLSQLQRLLSPAVCTMLLGLRCTQLFAAA